jgi:4-amino-4-deoxy-L-arabinose transferase-like glycosyltransferase
MVAVRPWVIGVCVALTAGVLAMRIAAPSDAFDNEQPKTIAYTVDIVANGNVVMPYDMYGRPATKPPLYNWLAVPVVASGQFTEWAFKLPSIIAMLVAMGLTVGITRRLLARSTDALASEDANVIGRVRLTELGLLAAVMLLVSHTGTKFIYLARPDTLMLAMLTGAWLCATHSLLADRPRWWINLICWLCVAGAAMCKGAPALLVPVYILLGAKLLAGRWSATTRTGIAWGLPLAVAIVGGWLWAAHRADSGAIEAMLGGEALGKVTKRGPWRIVTESYKSPGFLIVRFLPWSIVGLLAFLHVKPGRWFTHPLGPAYLWVLVVVGFFLIPADKRGDYLAPAMPAMAILATYWLIIVAAKYRITVGRVLVGCVLVAVGFGVYHFQYGEAAKQRTGDHVKQFADELRSHAPEGIAFYHSGYHNLQAYLGINQGSPLPAKDRKTRWIVAPQSVAARWGVKPVTLSHPLTTWPDGVVEPMGLYPDPGMTRLESGSVEQP